MLKTRKSSNPFDAEPLPKTFYYPSQQKDLTKTERKTCLSPTHKKEDQITSPETERFIKDIEQLLIHEAPTRENGSGADDQLSTSPFNESWPSTERTMQISTPETTETSKDSRDTKEDEKQLLPDTTLGRFIHRFRHAPPKNRQSRDMEYVQSGKGGEFWWLSPPSNSSTPSESTPTGRATPKSSLSPMMKKRVHKERSRETSPRRSTRVLTPGQLRSPSLEGLDSSTTDLQTRAKDLLEKSESTFETSSSETQIFTRKRTSDLPRGVDSIESKPSRGPATRHKLAPPPPPEDDILYQWRLAHKMEKAHERAAIYGAQHQSRVRPSIGIPQSGPIGDLECRRPGHLRPSLRASLAPTYERASSDQPHFTERDSRQGDPPGKPVARVDVENSPPESQETVVGTHSMTKLPVTSTSTVISPSTILPSSDAPPPPSVINPVLLDTRFTEADVPSHLHLSCDILPCPHQAALLGVATTHIGPKAPISIPVVESQGRELPVESQGLGSQHGVEPGISENETMHSSGQPDRRLKRQSTMNDNREQLDDRNSGEGESLVHQARRPLRAESSRDESGPSERLSQNSELKNKTCANKDSREKEHRTKTGTTPGPDVSTGRASYLGTVIGEVVSDRLFSTPVSSVSGESKRSSAADKEDIPQYTSELDAAMRDSSEDEFPDDEILNMLRSRARNYTEQLRSIDHLLSREQPV